MDGMNHKVIQKFPGCKRPYNTMRGMTSFAQAFKQISGRALPTSMSELGKLPATGAAGCYYDIYLLDGGPAPRIVVFMNLQFKFLNGKGSKRPLVWTPKEKGQFVTAWESAVTKIWNTAGLTVTGDRKPVSIQFRFGSNIEVRPPNQHWEINVHKVASINDVHSHVRWSTQTSHITHLDNGLRTEGNPDSKFIDNDWVGPYLYIKQVTSAHEFAHMIGIDDEYEGKKSWDYRSIASRGNEVRSRHMASFKAWADSEIRKLEKLRRQEV